MPSKLKRVLFNRMYWKIIGLSGVVIQKPELNLLYINIASSKFTIHSLPEQSNWISVQKNDSGSINLVLYPIDITLASNYV